MFTIADRSSLANLYVDNDDRKGVKRAANDLCEDIQRATGQKPDLIESSKLKHTQSIIIGTIVTVNL